MQEMCTVFKIEHHDVHKMLITDSNNLNICMHAVVIVTLEYFWMTFLRSLEETNHKK